MNFQYEAHNMRAGPCPKEKEDFVLAMAYVMMQPQITQVYCPKDAFCRGTLFPELDKPFLGKHGGYHHG